MITDYGTLQTAVITRSNRTDMTALVPDFIRRAHDIIVGEVVMAADLTLDDNTIALPTGFRDALSLWLVNRPWVQVCEASSIQMQTLIGSSGRPAVFRIDGTDLILYPSPEQTYAGKLIYRLVRDFFADSEATNAILTRYPSVYLYGAMAELGRQIMDDTMTDRYEGMFRNEIARINQVETGDALRGPLQMTSTAP